MWNAGDQAHTSLMGESPGRARLSSADVSVEGFPGHGQEALTEKPKWRVLLQGCQGYKTTEIFFVSFLTMG